MHGMKCNIQLEEYKEMVNGVQLTIVAGSWDDGANWLRALIGRHSGQCLNSWCTYGFFIPCMLENYKKIPGNQAYGKIVGLKKNHEIIKSLIN